MPSDKTLNDRNASTEALNNKTIFSISLSELANHLGAKLQGDGTRLITGVNTLSSAKEGELAFLDNPKYRKFLKTTQASVVILSPEHAQDCEVNALVIENPYAAYAQAAALFYFPSKVSLGIHQSAVIGKDCSIDETVCIGPHVVIGDRVTIGAGTQIDAGCVIGDECMLGEGCRLWPNVSIYYGCKLGNGVEVHSGAVIGSDGFGWAMNKGAWLRVPQLGGVLIEDDVSIGANTTIDRGAIESTVIERGVKLDNQIQIGHNVRIGAFTVVAGCVGISGSTTIGKYCMLGGGSGFAGHIEIADQVVVTGMSMITNSIKEPGVYSSGTGFMKRKDWQKNVVRFRQLDQLARRVRGLED